MNAYAQPPGIAQTGGNPGSAPNGQGRRISSTHAAFGPTAAPNPSFLIIDWSQV
jgi:hypothetical protein